MGKLEINDPIFSEDFKGKISFVGPMAIYWFLKMNALSCIFVAALSISFLFFTDLLSNLFLSTNYLTYFYMYSRVCFFLHLQM